MSLLSHALLVGCADDWEPHETKAAATLCVDSFAAAFAVEPGVTRLEAGSRLKLAAESGECFSASCSRHSRGSCQVAVDGGEISVSSEFRWEERSGNCPLDCTTITTECSSAPLAAGVYTLRFEGTSLEVRVPGELPNSCLGDYPGPGRAR